MENGILSLEDPNFVDQRNVLNHVSDDLEDYFLQLHLIDTIELKRPIGYMKEAEKHCKKEANSVPKAKKKKPRSRKEGGLFPYFIADHSKLPQDLLERL